MRMVPVGVRQRMRELSLGPVAWGMWSWTFQDGSCWASYAATGGEVVGWAAISEEVDSLPVVGCYVHNENRGRGLAQALIASTCHLVTDTGRLRTGDELFCAIHRWPRYTTVLAALGLIARPWE